MDKKVRFYRSLSILLNLLAAMYISWFVRVKLTGGEDIDFTWQYYLNMLWLMSPYFVLAVLAMRETASSLRSLILMLASLVVTGCGTWMILDAQYLREDGQIVETLRVLPWYQWAVCAVAALITLIDRALHPKPAEEVGSAESGNASDAESDSNTE